MSILPNKKFLFFESFSKKLTQYIFLAGVSVFPAAPAVAVEIFNANFDSTTGDNQFGVLSSQWRVNPSATDAATTGEWERANPTGTTYQVGITPSGDFCLVTDGANTSDFDLDIDGGVTSVRSPEITIPANAVSAELTLQHYLSHSGAVGGDFFRITAQSVTNDVLFEILRPNGTAISDGFAPIALDLTPYVGETLTFLIEAADAGGGNLVEAGVDDFRVTAALPGISGQVRYDVNGDGELANTQTEDRALAGVTVELFEGDGNGNTMGVALEVQVTDESGFFRFTDLSVNEYVVVASDLPDGVSSGESDNVIDGQIAVSFLGSQISDLVFLDRTDASGLELTSATYFLPYTESDILASLNSINSDADEPITNFNSISIPYDGTILLYDHWEDNDGGGYEDFASNPVQVFTEVWGDGNLLNGVAPGNPDDLLNSGDVIPLIDEVTAANSGTERLFDGRDKILASKYVSLTRAAWADGSRTLLAGAWELYPTTLWGFEYTLPIGEDIADAVDGQVFEYVGLSVQAGTDATEIRLNGNLVAILDEGETFSWDGGLNVGDVLSSTRASQVHIISGDIGSSYESRFFTLPPDSQFSNEYVASTSTPDGNATLAWLYNPAVAPIAVTAVVPGLAEQTLTIQANEVTSFELTNGEAARFFTESGEVFFAVATVDSDNASDNTLNQIHDWGYSLVPERFLTQLAVAGLAPGDDPTFAGNPENSAPLWVTGVFPRSSTEYALNNDADPSNDVQITICIDYNGDGNVSGLLTGGTDELAGFDYDLQVTLDELEQYILYVDNDGNGIPDLGADQTGTKVWVCDGSPALLAVAYGQDPNTASQGSPAVDFGTTVPGVPLLSIAKDAELVSDLNGNGFPDVGDTLAYTITVGNSGIAPFSPNEITVLDDLNRFLSYSTGTTTLVDDSGSIVLSDNGSGTPFPIDSDFDGFRYASALNAGRDFQLVFEAVITGLPADGTGLTQNTARASDGNIELVAEEGIPFPTGSIQGTVFEDTDNDDSGDISLDNVQVTLLDSTGNPVDFDPSTPAVEPYTVTTFQGGYEFPNLPEGDYFVLQSQPAGYLTVTDGDSTNGSDDFPNDSLTDNLIPVSLIAGELDTGNDFVERLAAAGDGSLSGTVLLDENNDDAGDSGISGVTLTLKDENGDDIDSDLGTSGVQPTQAVTDTSGFYSFSGLTPGDYRVVQLQPGSLVSVSDADGANNNIVGDETAIVVVGGADSGGNDFVEEFFGALSGVVSVDTDGDNSGDVGLVDVILTLKDSAGEDVDSDLEAPGVQPTTTVTNASGSYSFTGLSPGGYQVVETHPVIYQSISDADGGNLDVVGDQVLIAVVGNQNTPGNNFLEGGFGSLSGTVLEDTDNDGDGDDAIAGVTLTLQHADGTGIDSDSVAAGIQPTTTLTDENGSYSFTGLTPGNYRVVETQPSGFDSVSDVDGVNNDIIGDEAPIMVIAGGENAGNDFVEFDDKADTYAEFQSEFGSELGSESGPQDNPDGDIFDNVLEYAFCLNPGRGVPGKGEFCLIKSEDGTVRAQFFRRRGGLSDVTYTLEGVDNLTAPITWTALASVGETVNITDSDVPAEAEKVIYSDIQNATELTDGMTAGVIRLKVEVDADGSGNITSDEIGYSKLFGWHCLGYHDYQCATFSTPFSNKPVFSGTFSDSGVLSISTDGSGNVTLDVGGAAAGDDLSSVVGSNGSHYLQVTSGPLEGNRFDVLSGGTDELTLVNDPGVFSDSDGVDSLSTRNGIPADGLFNGASYEVIRYQTIDELFNPEAAYAGEEDTDPTDATRLLFYNNRRDNPGFEILMLSGSSTNNSKWVFTNDLLNLTDRGDLRVDPSMGNWIHPKSSGDSQNPAAAPPVVQFAFGMVAEHDQAVALNEGFNLTGAMWPVDQTPAGTNGRDLTVSAGFDGGIDPNESAELLFWLGDYFVDDVMTTTYSEGYTNYMLLDGGGMQNWIDINDIFLSNQDDGLVMESHRAIFLKLLIGDEKEPHLYPRPF